LVLVCDQCGRECGELRRLDYAPHGRRFIRDLAELVARELGLSEERIGRIRLAAMLCDVGRDQIPAEILNKRGPLTPEERATVRRQPELSATLLGYHGFSDIREWIASRRERPDGRGYPHGLYGHETSLEAKILGVVDAYAAMTTDKPYRFALDHGQAALELLDGAGSQFDAGVVAAFVSASARRVPYTGLVAA
jgi:HD-GYP domain-containing protein (c-di-GMP phosphodiesterase class II)